MPRAPRGKRVLDAVSGSYTVVGRAPNGEAEPYFDRSRGVWVAPWRKPDCKVGRPTGKTRAAAVASRNRHIAAAEEAARCGPLAEGFSVTTTLAELGAWWLENVARHRVRITTLSTYRKQWRLIAAELGSTPVRQLRTEQVAVFISRLVDRGAASRATNVRTLLVQVLDEAVSLGLAEANVAKKVRRPRVPKVTRPTLTPVEVVKLLDACDERFVAVVAFCYLHGWRVSEALGLAWQDLDLEAGTVHLRRGSTYADGEGMVLGPTKTRGTAGCSARAWCSSSPVGASCRRSIGSVRVGGRRRSTRVSFSISCSRRRRASRCCARTSIERSVLPLDGPASIRANSPRTPAGARWSRTCTPRVRSTSPTSPGSSATPTWPRPVATCSTRAIARRS